MKKNPLDLNSTIQFSFRNIHVPGETGAGAFQRHNAAVRRYVTQ